MLQLDFDTLTIWACAPNASAPAAATLSAPLVGTGRRGEIRLAPRRFRRLFRIGNCEAEIAEERGDLSFARVEDRSAAVHEAGVVDHQDVAALPIDFRTDLVGGGPDGLQPGLGDRTFVVE